MAKSNQRLRTARLRGAAKRAPKFSDPFSLKPRTRFAVCETSDWLMPEGKTVFCEKRVRVSLRRVAQRAFTTTTHPGHVVLLAGGPDVSSSRRGNCRVVVEVHLAGVDKGECWRAQRGDGGGGCEEAHRVGLLKESVGVAMRG